MSSEPSSIDYRFVDRWRVRGSAAEVTDILAAVTDFPRWWWSVYIEVTRDEPGDERGVGQAGSMHARGWMPFTLRSDYRIRESSGSRVATDVQGDLTGSGVWDIEQDGEWVDITGTWNLRSDKPLLRYLSPVFKPVLRSNHTWIMRQGERSLQLELDRRRASTPEERARVPEPPGPVPASVWLAGLGALLALVWGFRRLGRRRRA
jgi:hypothetical protein